MRAHTTLPSLLLLASLVLPFAILPARPALASPHAHLVHLASFRQEAEAVEGWLALKSRHEALAGRFPELKAVDLGPGKGVVFRLIVETETRAQADALVAALGREGHQAVLLGGQTASAAPVRPPASRADDAGVELHSNMALTTVELPQPAAETAAAETAASKPVTPTDNAEASPAPAPAPTMSLSLGGAPAGQDRAVVGLKAEQGRFSFTPGLSLGGGGLTGAGDVGPYAGIGIRF